MFELIKIVMEYISKALDPAELSKKKKEKELRHLGAKLYILYVRLNEIIVSGDEIISNLENYARRFEEESRSGQKYSHTREWGNNVIAPLMQRQDINIQRFESAIKRFSLQLAVIDNDAYLKIRYLLRAKKGLLVRLYEMLQQGLLPISILSEQDIKENIEMFAEKASDEDRRDFTQHIVKKIRANVIIVNTSWDEEIYSQVKGYLKNGKPKEQLKHLYEVASQLRASLENNFTISEILLEIGDDDFS